MYSFIYLLIFIIIITKLYLSDQESNHWLWPVRCVRSATQSCLVPFFQCSEAEWYCILFISEWFDDDGCLTNLSDRNAFLVKTSFCRFVLKTIVFLRHSIHVYSMQHNHVSPWTKKILQYSSIKWNTLRKTLSDSFKMDACRYLTNSRIDLVSDLVWGGEVG